LKEIVMTYNAMIKIINATNGVIWSLGAGLFPLQ
jgi:hypothetical protein